MLECPYCHCQLEKGKFCPECGTQLVLVSIENYCPACKCIVEKGKFCPECGTKLVAEPVASDSAPAKKKTSKKSSAKPSTDKPMTEEQLDQIEVKKAHALLRERRYDEAVRILRKYVRKENALAQLYMADCYDEGWGVKADKKKAYQLYKKSAEQGNPRATLLLGTFYECGDGGVKQNISKALKLYMKAHEMGDRKANSSYQKLFNRQVVRINTPAMTIGKYYNGEPVVDIRSSVYGWNVDGRYLIHSVVFYYIDGDRLEGPIAADSKTPEDCVLNGMLGSTRALQTSDKEITFEDSVFMIPCEQLWIPGYKGRLNFLAHLEVCELLANGQPVGLGHADFEFGLERIGRFLWLPKYELYPYFAR
jgi:hypothetical protein